MKIAIIGAGGFGREVYHQIIDCMDYTSEDVKIFDDNKIGYDKIKDINTSEYLILVAVGDPLIRRKIVESLPQDAKFFTFIHESAQIIDKSIKISEGSIICAGAILTTNITIGKHAHINLNTTIGHDCEIGDYFTSTPGVNISGNCIIGDNVYLGTNASIREKIKIANNTIIGLNSGVVKHITENGVYIGSPAKKIK